jgi:aspartate/methionine/tyrosine aminotransferase
VIKEKQEKGLPFIDLTESNPTRAGFLYPRGILEALADPGALVYEPHPRGALAARQAVSLYYRERGWEVDPERLFLCSGTSEAYSWLFQLLGDPEAEVLIPKPGYPLLEVLTRLSSVRLVHYRLTMGERGFWRIDGDSLRAAVSPRTAAIVVVDPNNPTGSYLTRGEWEAVGALCRQFGLALIVDEVFHDYPSLPRPAGSPGPDGVVSFRLNGLSKIAGLPQMKLAWILLHGPDEAIREGTERLEFISDAYLSVGTPIQRAAPRILGLRGEIQARILERLERNERTLRSAAEGAGSWRVLPREGGWYAVLDLPGGPSDEELAMLLMEEDSVLVHPGFFYDFSSEALVLSLLTPPEAFREGVGRLAARLRTPKHGNHRR